MCRKIIITVLALSLCLVTSVGAGTVRWDFENGNDHFFSLWSVVQAVGWTDDPNIAGDESITGVGGHTMLPDAGVAWTIGPPNQFDGQAPAVEEGCHVVNGVLEYGPCNDPFDVFEVDPPSYTNSRGQTSYLNTYNLSQWGDNLHIQQNDQIATSPMVVLGEGAVLTAWSHGGGSGTHAPEYDPDPAMMYTDGSSGIAVLSAEEEDKWALLASLYLHGHGTLTEDTLDLSEFAGKKVFIDVVDAFEGSWGWLAIDEIQITNATCKVAGFVVQMTDDVMDWGFDQAQYDHLQALGYHVVVIEQGEIWGGTFTRADANSLDLLLISESISSSNADPLRGTSTPVMHQEAYGWDNWNFMGPADNIHWLEGQIQVEIVNDTHPIIVDANFPVGKLPWFTAPDQYTTENISNMAPGAELLVRADADDLAVVFAIEKGAELADGSLAAGRVVGFSIPGNQDGLNAVDGIIDASIMTDEAWALYDAAIRWLDAPLPTTAAMIVKPDDLSSGFDQAQYARLVSMGYEVTIVPQSDVGSAFTITDAERFDLLLVSESISSSGADPLIGANVPMMHNESYGWDNHGFIVPELKGATWVGGSSIDVVNDAHPIAVDAGLSAGPLQFYSTDASWTADLVSALAPGTELIAQTTVVDGNNITDYALVFAIEQGAELAGGVTAANRIVGFSIPADQPYDAAVMTEEAWALWEAAVNWLNTPATPVTPTPAPPGPPAQMVAHWPMDDGVGTTVTDVVGGNNGTMIGLDPVAAWIADGALGGAVSFDNIDGHHIEVPHSNALDFGDVNFSISMMVRYPTAPVDTDRWIIKGTHGDPGTGSRYELFHTSGGTVRWTIDNGLDDIKSRVEVSNAAFVTGDWVHVVAIRDAVNDQLSIYADGVLQGTGTDSSGDISNGEPLWIGESTDETETAMSGDIDDVRIFDNVLTEDEITNAAVLEVVWDFENGNDHGFTLWSVNPATPALDDPNTAGDEALTGGWEEGNPNNLPEAGVTWTIGPPTMMDGLLPGADPAQARVDANGLLNYSLGTSRMTADHGFLNTYNLNLHGDFVHTQENDQIATSPIVQLYEGAILTATVAGSGADHEPILDEPGNGYTDGSGGIAVLSAEDGTLLASMETEGKGGEDPFTLDLSAFAGQKVIIEVVDAHEGGWGWMAVDKIVITNAQ